MNIVIIGGGAAGMMAAVAAASVLKEGSVTLLEKNEKTGRKLFITGKGRCNLTNDCDTTDFFDSVIRNPRFLYSAVYGFDKDAVKKLFEDEGLRLKTERGQRVFPASDHSSDVIRTLDGLQRRLGVRVVTGCEVKDIIINGSMPARIDEIDDGGEHPGKVSAAAEKTGQGDAVKAWRMDTDRCGQGDAVKTGRMDTDRCGQGDGEDTGRICAEKNGCTDAKGDVVSENRKNGTAEDGNNGSAGAGFTVKTGRGIFYADRLIIATGGISYSSTGSTGDGFAWAGKLGHRMVEPVPSLVPLVCEEEFVRELQGLSLKNVRLTLTQKGKKIYSDSGEMLFTHFGISGPLVLSASAYLSRGQAQAVIDLKPALLPEKLDERLLRDFEKYNNKNFDNALDELLPRKLIPVIVRLSGIDPHKKVNRVTRTERQRLAQLLKGLMLTVTGTRGFEEAIITRGGVSVKDINPSTMESRRVPGLYFAGEILDCDALTGGFNLQIAWSTGHLAGISAAEAE